MSTFHFYEEEELFPLSFVHSDAETHIANLRHDAHEPLSQLPPTLLAESPNGLELSDTELDDEIYYQQQLIGSPLLYTSERLPSSPEQYKKANYLISPSRPRTLESTLVTMNTPTPAISTSRLGLSTGKPIDDEFADAAQQNYRLWLKSV